MYEPDDDFEENASVNELLSQAILNLVRVVQLLEGPYADEDDVEFMFEDEEGD